MMISLLFGAQAPVAPTLWERLLFGGQIALVGMATVFVGLLVVWGVMGLLPKLGRRRATTTAPAGGHGAVHAAPVSAAGPELTAEVAHAIALAMAMDPRILDEDAMKAITVRKLTQPFSPWVHSGMQTTLTEKSFVFQRKGPR
jgi:hypothetical protein